MTNTISNTGNDSRLLGIGEFARTAGLSVSAVRFYAERGLLRPAEVDPSTGYRSYLPQQVGVACLIRDLRKIGMPLVSIEAAIELSPPGLSKVVSEHLSQLESDVERARQIAEGLGSTGPRGQSIESGPVIVNGSELCSAFEQVLAVAGTDPALPHLMTVRIEARDGSVRVVATDTYRLAVRDLVPAVEGEEFVALVASVTIASLLPQLAPVGQLALELRGDALSLSSECVDLSVSLIPADFPEYEPFLTQPAKATVLVADRLTLRETLEAFGSEPSVLLRASCKGLTVERGGKRFHVGASVSGPEAQVAVNPRFAIDSIDGALASEVIMEIEDDPVRPVVFRSATDGTYVSVLMPIKV